MAGQVPAEVAQLIGRAGESVNQQAGDVASAVEAMLEWCKAGPPSAIVERVESYTESPGTPFPGFAIR